MSLATRVAGWLRMDGWKNALSGIGHRNRDKTLHVDFTPDVVDMETALNIWRGDPMGARIVEMRSREALRQGYDLTIGEAELPEPYKPPVALANPAAQLLGAKETAAKAPKLDALTLFRQKHPSAFDQRVRAAIQRARRDAGDLQPLQQAVAKRLKDIGFDAALIETLNYRRGLGGGALLLGANDFTTDLREPLDLRRVRSFDWVTPLEARELQPLYWYTNPRAPKFGQVAVYQLCPYVVGASVDGYASTVAAYTQIHESRLIVLSGPRVSRRIMSGTWNGWGDSVFTRMYRALANYNAGNQAAAILVTDFAQAVYKIKNLAQVLATEGAGTGSLADKMMSVELSRSIARAVMIDSEEDFERKSTVLSGFPETLDRQALTLCAASGTPYSILMGDSPAGLQATGASDIRAWYDQIAGDQNELVAPALMRAVDIAIAAEGEDPDAVHHAITFRALWQPTDKEIAETRLAVAQADQIYLTEQVYSPEEVAVSRAGGPEYSMETHLDFEARAAMTAAVPPPVDASPKAPPMPPGVYGAGTSDPSALPSSTAPPVPVGSEPAQFVGDHADYSPDQERDERGRFAGGASGGDGAPKSGGHASHEHASAVANAASAHASGAGTPEAHAAAGEAHRTAEHANAGAGRKEVAASHGHAAEHHEGEAGHGHEKEHGEGGKHEGGEEHGLGDLVKAGAGLVLGEENAAVLGIKGE